MFSKLATYRSRKLLSDQKGKPKDYKSFNSKQNNATEDGTMKPDEFYFSSRSLLIAQKPSESYFVESMFSNSEALAMAAHDSDESSSLDSSKTYSPYSCNGSLIVSSLPEEGETGPVLLPYEDAEEEFLEDHESYFLYLSVDKVRKDQYSKLELQRIIYLDYATCPLYSRYQVEHHMQFLLEDTESFLGLSSAFNIEHSKYVDGTGMHILNLLNTTADDYSVIFTPSLPACYRLFGEMSNLQKGSVLLTSQDHHKFLNYMVHAAAQRNAKVGGVPLINKDICIDGNAMHTLLKKRGWSGNGCGLLVYPAQSVLTGMCHSLNWIVGAQQNGWKVLLDVSSCLPTVMVDLSLYQPEFVIGSMHHVLGYPSEVAFLLVRRSSHSICLSKGSTNLKVAERPESGRGFHVATEGESLNIHIFAALFFGLEHLKMVGIKAIIKRVESLIDWLIKTLKSLKHKLGKMPLLQLYGSLDPKQRGSILPFNVLDSTGNLLPARLVQQMAKRSNIFLDVGNLTDIEMAKLLRLNTDKQVDTLYLCNLQVVRLSLGPVSTFDDAYRLAQFLSCFRDEDYMLSQAVGYVEGLENEC